MPILTKGQKNLLQGVSKKPGNTQLNDTLFESAFYKSMQASIVFAVSSGKILKANVAACKLLGYPQKELLLNRWSSIFDIKDNNYKKMLKERSEMGHSKSIITAIKKSGKQIQCEITSVVFVGKDGFEKSITTLIDKSAQILIQKNTAIKNKKLVTKNNVLATTKQKKNDAKNEKIVVENKLVAKKKLELLESKFYEWKVNSGKTSFDIMWDWDISTNLVYVGKSVEKLLGYVLESNTIKFGDFIKILDAEEKKSVEKKLRKAIGSRNKIWGDSFKLKRKDGTIASTISRAIIQRDTNGKVTHLIGATNDLQILNTLRDKLNKEIALREQQSEKTIQTEKISYDIIWDLNLQTKEILVSEGFKNLFGYSIKNNKFKLSFWQSFIHPEYKETVEKKFISAIFSKEVYWEETYQCVRKNGTTATVICRGNIMRDADGNAYRMIGALHDISKQILLEDKILTLSQAVEQSASSIIITDTKGTIEYVNKKFVDLTGYSFAESIGANPRILKSGDKSDEEYKQLWQLIASGHTWRGEFHNMKKNGELYWEYAVISPIKNTNGIITKFLAIKEDITDRKQSEKQYSDLFEMSPLPMWLYDLETLKFILVNEAAIKVYGYSKKEFLSMTVLDIRPESEIGKTKNFIQEIRKEENKVYSGTFKHYKKSGEIIHVEISTTSILLDRKKIGSVIANDITEKNRTEHEINKAILKAQEVERYEIGGELHDNISQILAASKLSLGMMVKKIDPNDLKWLNQSMDYITYAIHEIRNLSHRLAPMFFKDKTLEEVFRKLFDEMNVDKKFDVKLIFDVSVKNSLIKPEIQLNVFRIMQEQLKNILKYSKAKKIEVNVFVKNNILSLRIEDNGVGFNVDAVNNGIGLANIKRRVELFMGKFAIESSVGNGCIVEVEIPLTL